MKTSRPMTKSPLGLARNIYGAPTNLAQTQPAQVNVTGSGSPHTNVQPYLCVSFIISLFGLFPHQ